MKRKQKKAIKQTFILFVTLCSIFVLISAVLQTNEQHHDPDFQMDRSLVTDDVIGYEDLVKKYAKQYDVADYTDVLLAMMMQESGGRGDDPMQASETYCGEIGCIEDPEVSIKQGV